MTDAAPRIWAFHAGPMVGYFVGREEVGAYVAPYILAAEHERLMAERDAEIARLREELRKIADADRLPTPSYGGVPGQYDYLPRAGRFGMMARAALGDDNG